MALGMLLGCFRKGMNEEEIKKKIRNNNYKNGIEGQCVANIIYLCATYAQPMRELCADYMTLLGPADPLAFRRF